VDKEKRDQKKEKDKKAQGKEEGKDKNTNIKRPKGVFKKLKELLKMWVGLRRK